MIELIASKDTTLQDKDAIIKDQDSALQDKDAKIKDQDAALQDKDEALQDKDKMIKCQGDEIYEGSIEEMIKDFEGIPDMPRVKDLHPHQDRNRDASFSVDTNFITPDDLNSTINYKTSAGTFSQCLGRSR